MTPPETRSSKRRVTRSSDAFPSPSKVVEKKVAAVAMRPAKRRRKNKQTGGIPVAAVARGKRIRVRGPFAGLVSRAFAGKLPRKEKKMKRVYPVTVKKVHSSTGRVERIGMAAETDEEDSDEEESVHCQAVGICTECFVSFRFGYPCPDCPSDSENFCTDYVPSDAEAGLYDSD
jgi:hypothetical protein